MDNRFTENEALEYVIKGSHIGNVFTQVPLGNKDKEVLLRARPEDWKLFKLFVIKYYIPVHYQKTL